MFTGWTPRIARALDDVCLGCRIDRPREVTAMFVAAGALLLTGAVGAALLGAPRLP